MHFLPFCDIVAEPLRNDLLKLRNQSQTNELKKERVAPSRALVVLEKSSCVWLAFSRQLSVEAIVESILMSALLKYHKLLAVTRILIEPCRLAGHSKWQNIRHTKQSNDAKRAGMISKYCLAVRKALVTGGGTDPKLNSALANVLAAAQKDNVPKDTLMRQIEKFNNIELKKHIIEIIGPNNIFLMVELETDDISRTRHDVKKILKKFKG